MTKAKKPAHDDSQIEEIDLSAIDLSAIDLDDLTSLEPKKSLPIKKEKEEKIKDFAQKRNTEDEDEDFDDPIITRDFDDDFDDDMDDEDIDNDSDDEDGEDGEGKKKDSYKSPKDFFTDKRRQKTLKKFIDVTVPQEFLDGLSDNLQLLIKK